MNAEVATPQPAGPSGPAGTSPLYVILASAACAYAVFHIWFATFGSIADSWRNGIHVGGALALFFALRGLDGGPRARLWLAIALICAAIPVYMIVMEQALYARNDRMIPLDMWVACGILALVLAAAGVAGGWVLTVLGVLATAYALWLGPFLPGGWGFRGHHALHLHLPDDLGR